MATGSTGTGLTSGLFDEFPSGRTNAPDEDPRARCLKPLCPIDPWMEQMEKHPIYHSHTAARAPSPPFDPAGPEISSFQSFAEMVKRVQRCSTMLRSEPLSSLSKARAPAVGG